MPASQYLETLILRHALLKETFVISGWWLALNGDTQADDEDEVTAAGRVLVQWDNAFTNANTLTWSTLSEGAVVRTIVFWDASSGGNKLGYGTTGFLFFESGSTPYADPGGVALDILNV